MVALAQLERMRCATILRAEAPKAGFCWTLYTTCEEVTNALQ
jgi:hypothetical protein